MKLQENFSPSSHALKEILKWNIQVEEKYLDGNIKINRGIKKKIKKANMCESNEYWFYK